MLKNLLRPKWQHPDPEVRAKVLSQGGIETEIALRLAIDDPELRVRQSAVAALSDITALVNLAERCPELRPDVAAALEPLLLPRDAGAELRERDLERAVDLLDERQQLKLLQRAGSVRLRVLAVRGVSDAQALCECALRDDDIHVRKAAIGRIDCPETLRRIAQSSGEISASLAELAERRAEIAGRLQARIEQRQAVLAALQGMLDGSKPLTEPAWDKQLAAWKELAEDAGDAERAAFEQAAAAIAPELEDQRRRRAADQDRRRQREQILEQLNQLGGHIDLHELDQSEIAIGMLSRSWSELEPMHDRWTQGRLQEQFDAALAEAKQQLEQRRHALAQEQLIAPALERLDKILARSRLRDKDLTEAKRQLTDVNARLKDKAGLAEQRQRLHRLVEQVERRLDEQRVQDQRRLEKLSSRLESLEAALQAQELKPALKAVDSAQGLLKEFGEPLPPPAREFQRRLRRSEPELRQLKSWAHWGNDQARRELIDEALALPDQGLDVDQLGKRLKALRQHWKSLGKLGPGGKAQWEEFDAACTRAHEPIKAQRESEKAQRQAHLQAREALCAEIESATASTDWERPDWRALDKTLQQFRRRWREAGPVPHKAWKKILARFEQAVDEFDSHLEKERRKNFLQRQALAQEAEQLAEQGDARAAVAAAKELRGRWEVTVHSRPKQERELWERFSAAMDRVFGKDRAERDQFKAGLDDRLKQGEALCEQLETLAGLEADRVMQERGRIAQLEASFNDLGEVPKQARRGLERRFAQARQRIDEALRRAEARRDEQELERLHQRHRLCERLEQAALRSTAEPALLGELEYQWTASQTDGSEAAIEQALQQRWERARAAVRGEQEAFSPDDLAANLARRQRICLELEILLGRDSPAEAQAERMACQVEMLQEAMSGGEDDRDQRVRRLRLDYLQTGPAAADAEPLAERFDKLFPKM